MLIEFSLSNFNRKSTLPKTFISHPEKHGRFTDDSCLFLYLFKVNIFERFFRARFSRCYRFLLSSLPPPGWVVGTGLKLQYPIEKKKTSRSITNSFSSYITVLRLFFPLIVQLGRKNRVAATKDETEVFGRFRDVFFVIIIRQSE